MFLSTSYVDMQHIVKEGYNNARAAKLRGPVEQSEVWSVSTYVLTYGDCLLERRPARLGPIGALRRVVKSVLCSS